MRTARVVAIWGLVLAATLCHGRHETHPAPKAAKSAAKIPPVFVQPPPLRPGEPLKTYAEAAVVMDAQSGAILYAKNAEERLFPASTTKVLTALLFLEKVKPDAIITAPKTITTVGEASLHLNPGEKLSAADLLKGMMLRSANDACVAAAVHIAGSVPAFAKLMNERAKELGCVNSNFVNPNGLHNKQHYTCARDLALIARAAMDRPDFRAIARMSSTTIRRPGGNKDTLLRSKNRFLKWDPTADGIKTGWTIPAGHCYVGSATRNGFRVITVVLKSPHWTVDHKRMLEWAFLNFKSETVAKQGDRIDDVAVFPQDVRMAVGQGEFRPESLSWRIAPTETVESTATAMLTDGDRVLMRAPVKLVTAERDVLGAAQPLAAVPPRRQGLAGWLIAGTLGAGAWWMRRRRDRFGGLRI